MSFIFDPSLPLGHPRPWVSGDRALATRVRMVLETRPGTLPWRPTFGCDLDGLVGVPTNDALINEATSRVEAALSEWLPDCTIVHVKVQAVPLESGFRERPAGVPVAEAALLTMGVQAMLRVDVELLGPDGPFSFSGTLEP